LPGQSAAWRADSLLEQGKLCIESEDYQAAHDYFVAALADAQQAGGLYRLAQVRFWLSESHYYLGRLAQAMEAARESQEILERHFHTDTVSFYSTLLNNISLFHFRRGDFEAQMEYNGKALQAALKYKGRLSEEAADVYLSIGAAYGRRGHWDRCIAYTDTSRQIAEAIGYQGGVASALLNLSYSFSFKADYDRAVQYQKEALRLTKSREEKARGLKHLGTYYIEMGDWQEALHSLEESLDLRRALYPPFHPNIFSTRLSIVQVYAERGELGRAADYLDEAIREHEQAAHPDTAMLRLALNQRASVQLRQGRTAAAEATLRRSAKLETQRSDINAQSALLLGQALLAQGRYDEAFAAAQHGLHALAPGFQADSLSQLPAWQLLEMPEQGRNLFSLRGNVLREMGLARGQRAPLDASLETFRQGDSLISATRSQYQSRVSRELLAANANDFYGDALLTLYHLYQQSGDTAFFDQALMYIEKNKALTVLENLNDLYARSFSGIPDRVVEAERAILRDIEFYGNLVKQPPGQASAEQRQEWGRLLFLKRREQDSLLAAIQLEYPRYYAMRHGYQLAAVEPLQRELLAEGETLLEYFVHGETVFVLMLSASQRQFLKLPAPQLEARIAALRKATIERKDTFYVLSYELYRSLVQPLEAHLAGSKLAIVPDGALSHLPFELLLSQPPPPAKSIRHAELPYLLRAYSIRYLLSANTALQAQRLQAPAQRRRHRLLALAPVFNAVQDGIRAGGVEEQVASLPGAQAELDSLQRYFRGNFLRGPEASEANFKRHGRRAGVYHIATHTLIDDVLPGSSYLLLAPGKGEDGRLHAYELYNLEIQAELAFLSACNTGVGRINKGEGSASLAHAFAYAGCPNLVMSLWPVRDRTTPFLVKRYYRHLAEGMDKSEALRQAKIDYLEYDELFAAPYYWGGFLYIGERSPTALREAGGSPWRLGLALALLCGLTILARWLWLGSRSGRSHLAAR
jgi:CHAT domain-containing protein